MGRKSAPSKGQEALEARLEREERTVRALREVGSALGTKLDLDELLEFILGKLTELVSADRATLYLLDDARGELVSRVVTGHQVRSIRVRVGHGIAGAVAQTGKAIRVKDAYADPRFEPEWDALTGYRTESMLAAPLKNHLGRTIGVIQVLNKRAGGEFTEDDEAMVAALTTQAAVAIDNSRLFLSLIQKNKQLLDATEQLERSLRDQSLLLELEQATARATSLDALASAALGKMALACDARGAALLLAEPESGDLVEYAVDLERPDLLRHFGVKSGEGLLAAAMRQTDVVSVVDRDAWPGGIERQFPFEIHAAIAVALEGETAPLGAVGIFHGPGRAFETEDLALLRLVSANVATAVRLFQVNVEREKSERLTSIGRLLSQVIHDFKTPMTVISGYVQLMQDTEERDKRTEYADEILRQFDSLTAMQREVLEFARGEKSLFIRKVYLKKFFSDLQRVLTHELAGKPVELVLQVDTKAVARFDEARVARAVHNLARNAVEAMSERGGELKVTGELVKGDLILQVADTGPGIPKEIEGRLFQSFVTAGKSGGTGLGLAIVKKIAEEHGGSVTVSSSPEGATFVLRLPQAPSTDDPKRVAPRRAAAKSTP